MSNILKSTKLDIALVKPYFKTICFTLLLPIVFAAINRSLLTGVSFAMCFIAMTTGYTFSITEKNTIKTGSIGEDSTLEIIEFPIAGIFERRSKVTKKPATGIYINTRPLIEPYL